MRKSNKKDNRPETNDSGESYIDPAELEGVDECDPKELA